MARIEWRLFQEGWTPSLSWWFGCLLGDGNVSATPRMKRVSIAGAPSTVSRWLALVAPDKRPLHIRQKGVLVNAVQGTVDSAALVQHLYGRWGLGGPKAFALPWPDDLPAEMLPHFVRGLWDTDGSLYEEKRRHKGNQGNDIAAAKYGSVDGAFVARLQAALAPITKSAATVTATPRKGHAAPFFTYRVQGVAALRLAHYLYADAPESLRNEERYAKHLALTAASAERATLLCPCGAAASRKGMCRACWAKEQPRRTGQGTSCSAEACAAPVYVGGLCSACYYRSRRRLRAERRSSVPAASA